MHWSLMIAAVKSTWRGNPDFEFSVGLLSLAASLIQRGDGIHMASSRHSFRVERVTPARVFAEDRMLELKAI